MPGHPSWCLYLIHCRNAAMNKFNSFVICVLILSVAVLSFSTGIRFEQMRVYHNQCIAEKGVLTMEYCTFNSLFSNNTLDKLNKSCPDKKGWYLTKENSWFHKCN